MKFGEDLWRARSLTLTDAYSYLTGDRPWINHEWLSEALFYLAFALGGPSGLVALKTSIALLILAILFVSLYRQVGDFLRTGILLILGSFIFLLYLGSIRPQMFTFLLFLLVLVIIRNAEEGRLRLLWWLPPIFGIWVNLHGGVLAGLGIFVVWIVSHIGIDTIKEGKLNLFSTSSRQILLVFLICLIAMLVNPYGPELLIFLLRTATVPRPEISDWNPVSHATLDGATYIILLTVYLAGLIFSARERKPTLVILFLCSAILPIIARRHTPLFALAAALLAADHVADVWKTWLPRGQCSEISRKRLLRLSVTGLNVGVALVLIAGSIRNLECPRLTRGYYPVGAVDLLKRSGVAGNLAVHFDWGEYALWHLGPSIKISVDGRRETVYSDEIYQQNLNFIFGRGEWDKVLDAYPSEMALVSKKLPVFNLMRLKSGWELIYEDPVSALFVQHGSSVNRQLNGARLPEIPYDGAGVCFP